MSEEKRRNVSTHLQDDVLAGFPGGHGEQGARGGSGAEEQLDVRAPRAAAASELVTHDAA